MKSIKHLTLALLLLMSGITAQAQQDLGEDSESVIIMSEDDIKSLAKILIEYKKNKADNVALNTSQIATTELMRLEKDSYEVDYLRNQIAQLENVIERINNSKATSNSSFDNDSNSLNRRELNNIKNDISQLKNLIQQLDNRTNNDLTVVVSSNELETKSFISPNESIIGEKIGYNDKQTIILENKLDSLNMLLKNLKTSDNPNYIDHFNALEKRIEALKTELNLKQSQPNAYEILVSKYKGFSKSIYFSNNSIVLGIEGNQVVEELNEILDKNDNVDIVVKGFASNKGNALYNETLSMQRTESVKKALILRGIHPTRVLTQYHGIDYKAETNKARRVDISILVRK